MTGDLSQKLSDLFASKKKAKRNRPSNVKPEIETLEVRELLSAAPLLAISANGRYLVNASNGQPFYLVGDTAWALPAGLTFGTSPSTDTVDQYFQTRASEGYNAVLMDADVELGASPVGAPTRGPLDANGNAPFTGMVNGTYDVSTPNMVYWNNIHNIVAAAGQDGIEVVLDVYDNYNPWFTGGNSPNSTAKLTAYGQFLGNEFKDLPNIIWMLGNDYTENSAGDADLKAVITGIRQNDTSHLGWAMDEFGATFDNTGLRSSLSLNSIYEYSTGPWRSLYLSQYNRSDFGPIFNIESGYENNTSLGVTESDLRDEHYSFLLAGATGDMYGNEYVWPFADSWQSWQNALTSEGAHEMTYLANFVNSVPWYNLTPDQNGTVFQGVGTPTDYSGAYTSDGTLAIAYKPSTGTGSQSFTVNMSHFVGSVTAQWYDPTNGTYTNIGTFANTGTHTFNSPSTNSAGANDFVLVLKSAATVPAAPTGLTATAGNTAVTLNWTASAGAVSYNIYRSTASGQEVKIATNPATLTTTSYTDTGLTNGTTYFYKVTAVNSAGESSLSSEASAKPLLSPPTTPTNLTAASGNNQVTLSWTAVLGATSYNIYRSTTSGGEVKIGSTTATSDTDTGLTNGTKYFYEVTAVNSAGESSKSSEVSATPSPVNYVQSASSSSDSSAGSISQAFNTNTLAGNLILIAVSWDTTTGNTAAPTITDSQGNSYTLATYANDTRHNQALAIFYASAIKGGADTVTATFPVSQAYRRLLVQEYSGLGGVDVTASNIGTGTAPTSGSATTTAAGDLIFGAVMDDSGTTTITAGTGFTQRQFTASNDTASEDRIQSTAGSVAATANFAASADYLAQMVAFKPAGGTTVSAPTITSQPSSLTVTAGQSASFTVVASGTAPLSYQWQKQINGTWTNISGATSATYTISSTASTDAGSYRVTVSNSAGSVTSNTATLTVNVAIPSAPTGLSATAGNGQVTLNWTAVAGATSYNIYRSTTSGSEVKITTNPATITTTSYTDTGLTNGTTYFYKVTAVNTAGESGKSSEVSATPAAPPTTWTYDQTNAQQTASATNALSMTANTKAGDLVIVEVDWASSVNFSSITDSQGNTYVEIGAQQHSSSFNANSRLYYASNIKGGALTVTTQLSGAPAFHELYISEYSGLNATAPLDAFSVNVGTGSSFTSNNVTTTAAGELLYGIEIDSAVASASAGWTVRSSFDSNVAADKTATNVGSYAFTGSSSGAFISWIAAFKLDPPANQTETMGETNVLTNDDSGNGNLLVAQKATLSKAATLRSLSFYVTQAAGQLRLGVYDSSGPGGGPGKLLAQTNAITPVVGWNTVNVTTPVSLSSGTYWLAYLASDNNLHFVKTSGAAASGEFYSYTFGALPTVFSTTPSTTSSHWSFFATLG